ncbi:hypothetical protein [Thermococcus sp.]|uniref:hypothetical protein n=1 Tax=Thermococcus sp. TaxID=35749 RepID=UPI0025EB8229|nr:hypothetical protein [Thermococcus sp.]
MSMIARKGCLNGWFYCNQHGNPNRGILSLSGEGLNFRRRVPSFVHNLWFLFENIFISNYFHIFWWI